MHFHTYYKQKDQISKKNTNNNNNKNHNDSNNKGTVSKHPNKHCKLQRPEKINIRHFV